MIKTAVLLTAYNRKDITLQGVRSLYRAMFFLGKNYSFDIYMTDDGSTDGTAEAITMEFPNVVVIQGDGNLYWSGGMRKAWQTAIDSGIKYDFFLWFNDDDNLYENSLLTMFSAFHIVGSNAIVTGAFCDNCGSVSYGGTDSNEKLLPPNGSFQEIKMMNGNLVLIPISVYLAVGNISLHYKHGFGDYDYGLRCQKVGMKVFLTSCYVGVAERHDDMVPSFISMNNTFAQRWKILHSPKDNPFVAFRFNLAYRGAKKAWVCLLRSYFYLFFPVLYKISHRNMV